MLKKSLTNPFRPGAGHRPPYLAGREAEKKEFRNLLDQEVITDNPIITGLRGVGKTVLLDELKPIAVTNDWWWVGTDLSESASLTEERIAIRLLADLSVTTAQLVVARNQVPAIGFSPERREQTVTLNYETLVSYYNSRPGLTVDKLKAVLELVWLAMPKDTVRGIVFAYDEAQNLADHTDDKQYPLSLVLELFQSAQAKGMRFMLVLVGLPTLFPKLVEARTWAERMFHVITLGRLSDQASRAAIEKPIKDSKCPLVPSPEMISEMVAAAGGYPYFIQFIGREAYDVALQKYDKGEPLHISITDITRKLDEDFFSGRWAKATDRIRDLLRVIAELEADEDEFTVQQIVAKSKTLVTSSMISAVFSSSYANQLLAKSIATGFVYKNRHGCYVLAVPLLGRFIRRQPAD